MSATLYSTQRFEVELASGETLVISSDRKEATLTTGVKFECVDVIADDYGEDVLWATGYGGMDTFELMLFYSDKDVWLEFKNDDGTPAYVTRKVTGGVWHVFPGYNLGSAAASVFDGAVLVDNTDYDDVTQIECHNDAADGAGDASVRLVLLG